MCIIYKHRPVDLSIYSEVHNHIDRLPLCHFWLYNWKLKMQKKEEVKQNEKKDLGKWRVQMGNANETYGATCVNQANNTGLWREKGDSPLQNLIKVKCKNCNSLKLTQWCTFMSKENLYANRNSSVLTYSYSIFCSWKITKSEEWRLRMFSKQTINRMQFWVLYKYMSICIFYV